MNKRTKKLTDERIDIYDALSYIGLMKITALISDELVEEVKRYSKGRNITESLTRVLEEWLALEKIKELNGGVDANPLEFQKGFDGEEVRKMNRRKEVKRKKV